LIQPSPYDAQVFSARLSPHRSLERRHFLVLMMVFCAAMFLVTIPFVLVGAWPVVGFMGLDVLGFWWAFRVNYRAAKAYEDVRITHLDFTVDKVSPGGERRRWRFDTMWAHLRRQEHEEYGLEKLHVVSRGQGVELASFLGPEAKTRFARDLTQALIRAKRGPDLS